MTIHSSRKKHTPSKDSNNTPNTYCFDTLNNSLRTFALQITPQLPYSNTPVHQPRGRHPVRPRGNARWRSPGQTPGRLSVPALCTPAAAAAAAAAWSDPNLPVPIGVSPSGAPRWRRPVRWPPAAGPTRPKTVLGGRPELSHPAAVFTGTRMFVCSMHVAVFVPQPDVI